MLKKVAVHIVDKEYAQCSRRCEILSEKQINITEKMQQISETVAQYKDAMVAAFKDMDVEIKDWNLIVGKVEKQYNVEVMVKLAIKPKEDSVKDA